jgi:hypothetical protein
VICNLLTTCAECLGRRRLIYIGCRAHDPSGYLDSVAHCERQFLARKGRRKGETERKPLVVPFVVVMMPNGSLAPVVQLDD